MKSRRANLEWRFMKVIIDYKALLNKDDIIALYDLDRYKPQTQKNYCYNIMKQVKEAYKKETGTDWEDSFTQRNIHQKVIPTETFLKCCPEFRKSFRR